MDYLVNELGPNQMLAIFLIGMGKEMPESITKVDLTELITFLFQKLDWSEKEGNWAEVAEEKTYDRNVIPNQTRSTRNQDNDDTSDNEINSDEGIIEQENTNFTSNVAFGKPSNRILVKKGGPNAPETSFLNNHERQDGTRPKSFICFYCEKSFAQAGNLKTHERIHTGDKPFECSQCGKSFTTSSHLKKHEMFHTGVKPHQCSYCDRKFTQKSDLNSHIRTHTSIKPFRCFHCDKKFSRAGYLKIHKNKHCRFQTP